MFVVHHRSVYTLSHLLKANAIRNIIYYNVSVHSNGCVFGNSTAFVNPSCINNLALHLHSSNDEFPSVGPQDGWLVRIVECLFYETAGNRRFACEG